MKVIVSRSGGITGIRVTWQVRVDMQPDADWWQTLINGLPWNEIEASEPKPDRYVYRIRCAPHEVVLAEPQVQGPWRELVDRVKEVNDHDQVSGRERHGEQGEEEVTEQGARNSEQGIAHDSSVAPPSGESQ
ncbi:protealysin inhibitor emfourin [Glaciibacter superstes]|uniref:protealysin inhibitor emfourin n=1 Tax=Glaciibacter superstes TaxID=501023 RepID=UPI0003B3413B|nr:protealysin inhibitor emfourin [Glaciibacter superstes]